MNLSLSEESLVSLNFPAICRLDFRLQPFKKIDFLPPENEVMFSQACRAKCPRSGTVCRGGGGGGGRGYSMMHQMHHGIGHIGGYPPPSGHQTWDLPPPFPDIRCGIDLPPPPDIKRGTYPPPRH